MNLRLARRSRRAAGRSRPARRPWDSGSHEAQQQPWRPAQTRSARGRRPRTWGRRGRREAADRGAEDAADQAAGEHQRDRGRLEVRRSPCPRRRSGSTGHRRCRRPTPACRSTAARSFACHIAAAHSSAPTTPQQDARGEAALAAHALHVQRCRHGGERAAQDPGGHRQRGEADVGRERKPRQAVDGDERRIVGEQHRLAGGEQPDVALRGTVHCLAYCSVLYSIGAGPRRWILRRTPLTSAAPARSSCRGVSKARRASRSTTAGRPKSRRARAADEGHHRAGPLDHLAQRFARRRLQPVDQPVSRLRARLHLLLCPPEPLLPRALAGPGLRDQALRQDQRRRAAARGARASRATGPARSRSAPTPTATSRSSASTDHARDPRGARRVQPPGHAGDQVGAGRARPRPARADGAEEPGARCSSPSARSTASLQGSSSRARRARNGASMS